MATINFFLPMIPPTITQQQHKIRIINGRPQIYDPPELKAARYKFQGVLTPHAPEMKITGPVRLLTKWIWPLDVDSEMMEKLDPTYFVWKDTKPDTDNLIKLFKDCMTAAGFWEDDCQVVSEITEKMYSFRPGIYVEVTEL